MGNVMCLSIASKLLYPPVGGCRFLQNIGTVVPPISADSVSAVYSGLKRKIKN
jgi:hypothetical protein